MALHRQPPDHHGFTVGGTTHTRALKISVSVLSWTALRQQLLRTVYTRVSITEQVITSVLYKKLEILMMLILKSLLTHLALLDFIVHTYRNGMIYKITLSGVTRHTHTRCLNIPFQIKSSLCCYNSLHSSGKSGVGMCVPSTTRAFVRSGSEIG